MKTQQALHAAREALHTGESEKRWAALALVEEALAEPENRCVRELREYAKENPGAYIFPRWDGNRVLKYLAAHPAPAQQGHSEQHLDMVNAKLFAALKELLGECADGIATSPLTRDKAREAIAQAEGKV